MGQVLHGSATTTHAIRASIQRSQASVQELSERYGINPKTVRKWRRRGSVEDAPMGPKERRSTVLSPEGEALIVAFRKHTLLPLDDCLYALPAIIPRLTRSNLRRLFQHHDISRRPSIEGDKPKKRFLDHPIGYVHIDIAELRSEGWSAICIETRVANAAMKTMLDKTDRNDARAGADHANTPDQRGA